MKSQPKSLEFLLLLLLCLVVMVWFVDRQRIDARLDRATFLPRVNALVGSLPRIPPPQQEKHILRYEVRCPSGWDMGNANEPLMIARKFTDGSEDLLPVIEKEGEPTHGNCAVLLSADKALVAVNQPETLYISFIGVGDFNPKGIYSYDIQTHFLHALPFRYPENDHVISATQRGIAMLSNQDSLGETKEIVFLDFQNGTTTILGILPSGYSFTKNLLGSALWEKDMAQGSIRWNDEDGNLVADVYSKKQPLQVCDSTTSTCAIRVPAFQLMFQAFDQTSTIKDPFSR